MERDVEDMLIDLDLMIHGILEQAKQRQLDSKEIERVYVTLSDVLILIRNL